MRTLNVLESSTNPLDLTRRDAEDLNRIGTMLSARSSGENLKTKKAVVRCLPTMDGRWSLTVENVVGVIGLSDMTLLIQPKIPVTHLLYLLSVAGIIPRVSDTRSELAGSSSFADLVANWYLGEVEKLLRGGLLQDYEAHVDDVSAARGQILPLASANNFYSGLLAMRCRFDDFGVNTPLNRILRAATEIIVKSTSFPNRLTRRARLVLARFETVGPLDSNDLLATLDRRTASYSNAVRLAKLILGSTGVTLEAGWQIGWTFLFATPDLVERACREILAKALIGHCEVLKIRIPIGHGRTISPDLVFQGDKIAVGDVKYKIFDESWNRDDLYQVVAFAAGFKSTQAAIVSFVKSAGVLPPRVKLGDIEVTPLAWPASPDIMPEEAEKTLVAAAITWFKTPSTVADALSVA